MLLILLALWVSFANPVYGSEAENLSHLREARSACNPFSKAKIGLNKERYQEISPEVKSAIMGSVIGFRFWNLRYLFASQEMPQATQRLLCQTYFQAIAIPDYQLTKQEEGLAHYRKKVASSGTHLRMSLDQDLEDYLQSEGLSQEETEELFMKIGGWSSRLTLIVNQDRSILGAAQGFYLDSSFAYAHKVREFVVFYDGNAERLGRRSYND